MRRRALSLLMLSVLASSLAAWQWPMESFTMATAFGQSMLGAYARGVELGAPGRDVYPVSNGTVIYAGTPLGWRASQMGTVVIVEHDHGFRSFYGHLEEGSTANAGAFVDESTAIGRVATSSPTLYFGILDTESGAWVNPQLLLPQIPDRVRPAITSVLAEGDSALIDLIAGAEVRAGEYRLIIGCEDQLVRGGAPVAPYSVTVLIDGQQRFSITHDRIVFQSGEPRVVPGPDSGYDQIHSSDGGFILNGVGVPVGRTLIELVVRDYAGNQGSLVVEVTGSP